MKHAFAAIIAASLLTLPTTASADHHDEATEAAPDRWDGFSARGNEPFWSATISADTIEFEHLGVFTAAAARESERPVRDGTLLTGPISAVGGDVPPQNAQGRALMMLVEDRHCSDSMAGLPFPKTVRIILADSYFEGCGGTTEEVMRDGEFTVANIGGEAVPEGVEQSIRFDGEGGIFGAGGCNRYRGSYELSDGLTIGAVSSTRMACPGPRMQWESRLFDAFQQTISFEIAEDGTLTLFSESGPLLTATR